MALSRRPQLNSEHNYLDSESCIRRAAGDVELDRKSATSAGSRRRCAVRGLEYASALVVATRGWDCQCRHVNEREYEEAIRLEGETRVK